MTGSLSSVGATTLTPFDDEVTDVLTFGALDAEEILAEMAVVVRVVTLEGSPEIV